MNAALTVLASTWPLLVFTAAIVGILCAADYVHTKRGGR